MKTDQTLMQMICEGSHSAFAELVHRHTERFLALSYRTLRNHGDAEDVVQNSFVKLWQNPTAWRPEKSMFTTWFYRVILNACHDVIRKNKHTTVTDSEAIERSLQPSESEQSLLELKQEATARERCLQAGIAQLPSAQRDALNLAVYCALPQQQAAEILGLSLKAFESSLFRAKRNLADKVREEIQLSDTSAHAANYR